MISSVLMSLTRGSQADGSGSSCSLRAARAEDLLGGFVAHWQHQAVSTTRLGPTSAYVAARGRRLSGRLAPEIFKRGRTVGHSPTLAPRNATHPTTRCVILQPALSLTHLAVMPELVPA